MVISSLLLLAGCVLGPDYTPVSKAMPSQWNQSLSGEMAHEPNLPVRWWEVLEDTTLNGLIEQARANNPTLEAAGWRIHEVRATRDYVLGRYYPNVDAVGSYNRVRSSDYGLVKSQNGNRNNASSLYSAGFDASWELYLFGQFDRAVESAQASFEAEIENYHDILISLYAEVAANYVDLRTTQARIQFAGENLELQKQTLKLAESRFKAGLVPELDIEQAKLNLTNTESDIPLLLSREQADNHRLCVLTGLNPGELSRQLSGPGLVPRLNTQARIILPAQLLRQRPDIRRAERQLAAQTANIGLAEGDLYPTFTLNGSIALQATDFSDITRDGSEAYSFGPGFRWAIFDANRIKNNIRIQETRTQQLFYQYQQTVLTAQEEVENAITDFIQEKRRNLSLAQSVDSAKRSSVLVETLYKSGLTDFQNVLVTQRSLSAQQDSLAASQGQMAQNLIRLYKALGGGWDPSQPDWIDDPNEPVQPDAQAANSR
jgi:NodT family efflux transporter outer membrane factor (OMF) lipoprotein